MVTELRAGMHVGRYRLVDRIAQGGMGSVWSAHDARLERMVAIKMLPRILVTDPSAERRFEREARAMGRLRHPNVVTVYDVGTADPGTGEELPYLVMELIEGRSLDRMVEEGPLEAQRAVAIMEQVSRALASAHQAGVVHRDLKPSNVMVDTDGHVKVLDFGLARLLHQDGRTPEDTLTTPGMVLGSCPYMAPEQALGQDVNPASDIFSCGAVLYEALSGRRAFDGSTPMKVLQAVVRCEYPPLDELRPELPGALTAMVERCMQKDPMRRYQDGHALADDLASLAESGELRLASAPTLRVPTARGEGSWWSSFGWSAVAAAVLIAALGGALGFRWGRAGMDRTRPDPGSWNMKELVTVRGALRHPSWSPDGERLAVDYRAPGQGGEILVIDRADGRYRTLAAPADSESLLMPRFSPDGRAVVFSLVKQSESALRIVPSVGGETFVEVPNAINGDWLDSRTVVFSRSAGEQSEIWSYELDHNREQRLRAPGADQLSWWRAAARPGGGVSLVGGASEARTGLFVAAHPTARAEQWLAPQDGFMGFSWAPSGRSAVVSLNGALAQVGAFGVRRLLPDFTRFQDPSLSRDGRSLALVSKRMTNDLVEVFADGSGWSCLLCGVPDTGFGAVGPGGEVVYRRLVSGVRRLVLRRPDGREEMLSAAEEEACCPAFSPNGGAVAYLASSEKGLIELRLRSLDGDAPVVLAAGLEPSEYPSWSPDGRMVAYAGGDPLQVFVVPAVGGLPRAVSPPGGDYPSWSPDGERIAYVIWTEPGDKEYGAWVVDLESGSATKVSDLATRVVWGHGGSHLRQLRRVGEELELWTAEVGSWQWRRESRLDPGQELPVHFEYLPLARHPSRDSLVVNRRLSDSSLSVCEGLDPERW